MKRGPTPGTRVGAATAVEKARLAWGEPLRAEVLALAEACDASSQSKVAKVLGCSPGLISYMIANRYPGDVETVLAKVRGAFMGEVVICPVIGEIGRNRCLTEQKRPFAATNSIRVRLFHACRSCPENRQNKDAADDIGA